MRTLVVIIFLLLQLQVVYACRSDSLSWWDPAESSFPVIGGKGWQQSGMIAPYQRLPLKAQGKVRSQVWALSRNATGLTIRFRTDAHFFSIRYTVEGALQLPHFPATGFSGLDLYSRNSNGGWNWIPGKYAFKDTITYSYTVSDADSLRNPEREYFLYLPIYNTVRELRIGMPKGAAFTPLAADTEKPVVIYGTSITQGGCASRPGLAWTSVMGRKLELPVVNLGFSGNGTLDKEMVELINELDAGLFVLDCLGNMMDRGKFPLEEVKRRIAASVSMIRAQHPSVPILLPAFAAFHKDWLTSERQQQIREINNAMLDTYRQLKKEGVKYLYVLPAEDMKLGPDHTVDHGHPNDAGHLQYAEAFAKTVAGILKKHPRAVAR